MILHSKVIQRVVLDEEWLDYFKHHDTFHKIEEDAGVKCTYKNEQHSRALNTYERTVVLHLTKLKGNFWGIEKREVRTKTADIKYSGICRT